MNNIVSVKLDSRYASTLGVWQYDYGQVLRITGPELPPAVEVQFSLTEKSGETLSRVGTTVDGVTEVKIPDELLKHSATSNYRIYAYIYLTDETSGNTKYEITIPVRVRSRPTSPAEDPETDPDLFRETVVAVNASAERAKMAEQNAKESATEAGKYAASASESAVTAEKTKEDALRKVGEKKREAIEAIQNQEETSVGKITTHTDGEIQRIQNQAAESKGELEQTIINAGVSKEELDESIQTASDTKTALDKSVELAGTAKTELDTSIREAGTAKIALDESTETAGTVQETLSATVKQAGALDTSLGEKIETGTQLKTDLVASGEKAVQDIQTAGSEQLGKLQAVAEEFTADREQIATNKEDIGSLKEDLGDIESKFEIETEAFSNKCSIIRNNTPNNFTGNQITGVKQYFDFGENAALTKIKMNIKASNDDTVVLEIATLDGNIIATAEKAVTTEYTDVVFDLENIVIKEPVSVFVYTKGTNLLSYGLYATPYDDQSFSYIFPDGTRKSAFKIGTSEIPKPTTSNNKQCLVLFFDYTSKIIKNISDSISQNIDTTLLKSGKAADAKVVGDKVSKLEEDLSNKITKFYASNQGETHLADSDNGKIMDMMLYGRNEQKQYRGKNLLKIRDGAQTTRGVTVTAKDGVVALKGTATETGWAILDIDSFVLDGTCILSSNISTGVRTVVANKSFKQVLEQNKSNTLENAEASKVCFTVKGGETYDISNILVQIEKGSKATSYEPYVGGQPSPSPDYPQEIKSVVNPTVKVTNEDGLKVQSVTLNNITLNAIPVASGGNVTIDGQQWVCDEIDLKRGVRVQRVATMVFSDSSGFSISKTDNGIRFQYQCKNLKKTDAGTSDANAFCSALALGKEGSTWFASDVFTINKNTLFARFKNITSLGELQQYLQQTPMSLIAIFVTPIETPLAPAEIAAFNAFTTYYPVTNISVNSEQLDGYTVFNYPISMENGWNYVKQQLGDTRDYIYDMDAKAQDIDIQSAEAYVNSEYAVALTELEV